ncbi:hypothetical protein R3P38DRAFT_3187434 [Favolaschia claudopus]|uniref:DUF6534 domain-containing protein n=1 Tax=Favolaschia claudopus TaxID=2862362 RepID=A0AAW0BY10_9AGAR
MSLPLADPFGVPVLPSVHGTFGALLIGVLVSYVLFGVVCTQAYIYNTRFPNDSGSMKALVAFVWACELAHCICIGHALYILMVSDFGHPERLATVPISLGASCLFNAVVALCTQGFFSMRIWRLSKSFLIPLITWALSLAFLAGSTVVFAMGLERTPFLEFESKWGWLLNTIWSVSAVNDIIIAISLVFWLSRGRDKSEMITPVVDKLIGWTIETGVVTRHVATVFLLTFNPHFDGFDTNHNVSRIAHASLRFSGADVWIAWYFVASRLYSNSFLARQPQLPYNITHVEGFFGTTNRIEVSVNTLTAEVNYPNENYRNEMENYRNEMRTHGYAWNSYPMPEK